MDVHSKETRSYNMSRITAKDTKPEVKVRKYLFAQGFRYRKNDKRYPGHPDIVLPKYKTMIFVNGCFWHMHEGCSDFSLPQSNTAFWENKLLYNRARDEKIQTELKKSGWNVIIIWTCEIKGHLFEERMSEVISTIKHYIVT